MATKRTEAQQPITRIAVLRRVSTDEQAKEGYSLEAQRAILENFAHFKGWQIVADFVDDGYTGATDKRPGLQQLMDAARAREFDAVVVTKLDRLFRDLRLLKNHLYELDALGIAFIACQEGLDTSSGLTGRLMLNMVGSFAEFERGRIGERVKDVRHHLKEQGRWSSGRTSFGYWYDKPAKRLVIDPLEAESVRFVFRSYLTREIGVWQLAGLCNTENILPPQRFRRSQGGVWTPEVVYFILKNPAYKGGPNEDYPFSCPVIIEPDAWHAVQRRLRENYHFRDNRSRSPFQGLLRCGICGRTLRRGHTHGATGAKVWECPGRLQRAHMDGTPRCTLPRMKAEALERDLSAEIAHIFSNPAVFGKYVGSTLAGLQKEHRSLKRRLLPIQGNIGELRQKVERERVIFRNGGNRDEFERNVKVLNGRIAELERQTQAADPMLLSQIADIERSIEYWRGFPKMLNLFHSIGTRFPKPTPERTQQPGRPGAPVIDRDELLHALVPVPDLDVINDPVRVGASQLRKLGLFAYVHADKIEIRGAIPVGKASITSASRYPRRRQRARTSDRRSASTFPDSPQGHTPW